MFPFGHRSTPRFPTIRQALYADGLASAADTTKLTVLERRGPYSGRPVTFFRAFDPSLAAMQGVPVRAFRDLDAHLDLVVGSGHVEREGNVVIADRREPTLAIPTRQPAVRASHADDEHLVFWSAEGARSSAQHLSEAASSWLQATPKGR